jgi:hypothetical protein
LLIVENSVLEFLDIDMNSLSIQRVLWISPDEEDVVVVDITDNKNMKFPIVLIHNELVTEINEGRVRLLDIEPDLRLISPDIGYLNKYKEDRDANWNVISDIVIQEPHIYLSSFRGKLVKKTIEETGRSKKEIYRLLKRYWFYGKTKNGLLKNYFDCGAPGKLRTYTKKPGPKSADEHGVIVSDRDKKIFEKAVQKFHVDQKMDITSTHRHMCEEYFHSGFYRKNGVMVPIVEPEKAPTLRQFSYWYNNEYSFAEKYSKRHGKRKTEMNIRPLQGDSTARALAVGYLFEIDSTPADVILVAEDRQTNLGTPTLYIVKDVFSRAVVGFHASLSPPSTIEQMVALENAATNKVEFCKQYNIEIEESDWPCSYLPQFLVGDRGELKSKWTENLVNLKVDVANAPSYRGDLKPFVEQHFNLTNNKIRELLSKAGAKPAKLKERGDFDPARNAALTIFEFTQFMILQIIAFNKSSLNKEFFVTREMFDEKVELTPLGVWNWGLGKNLLHEEHRDSLRYNLLPKGNGTVTRWGIKFIDWYYTSKVGIDDGWFVEQQIEGQKYITLSYDPRNISSVFIRLKNGQLLQCFLTDKYKEYEGLHIEDVKAIMKYKKEQIKMREKEEKQHLAELNAFSKNLVKEATKAMKEATSEISFYERQKEKREKKKQEGRNIGAQNAWTAIKPSDSIDIPNKTNEVFPFRKKSDEEKNNQNNKIERLFGEKNRARRRNHESME